MTLNDIAKFQTTWSVALCDSHSLSATAKLLVSKSIAFFHSCRAMVCAA